MKVENDKFYTKENVAKYCISLVPCLESFDLIIEPAAGAGSFSRNIKNCKAFDIKPEAENIECIDFLSIKKSDLPESKKTLFIGNPPFGERSTLAKKFITKSIELGADTIAFILPDTFNKISNQKVFPMYFKLIKKEKLDESTFIADGKSYYVPCTFFIWSKSLYGQDLRETKILDFTDFTFLKRGDKNADFSINGNNGKIKELNSITNPKAEHYIKCNDDVNKVRRILESIDWNFNSSINGKLAWLSQQDIIKQYIECRDICDKMEVENEPVGI